jgi:DNA invertase Pin-like site-specific DNA recombinase
MRIALYVRVSTKDGKQEYENQLLQLRKFVASNEDWSIVKEYADRVTGSTADRPQFKLMFEDASKREFDLLLFWSLDRFSREGVLDTLQHLKRLTSQGIEWFSFKEEYLRSIGVFRDAVLAILAVVAQQERLRMSERVTAGLERARKQGKHIGRPKAIVDRIKVEELKAAGVSVVDIAKKYGISIDTIYRVLKHIPKAIMVEDLKCQ